MKSFVGNILMASTLALASCADHGDATPGDEIAAGASERQARDVPTVSQEIPGAPAPSDDASATPPAATGVFPPVADPGVTGSFTPTLTKNLGPNRQYTVIAPKELGANGVKHPILVWGPGAGAWPEIYLTLLNHVASHGFVIVSYNTTPQGPELTRGLDWIIAEAKRSGSPYFEKVDTTRIAMGGQSAGSLGTFNAAKNEQRLTTTVHLNGGTFPPHAPNKNLSKPALFLCGEKPSGGANSLSATVDIARPYCEVDFQSVSVPVWFGGVNKSGHTTVIDNPLGPARKPNDPLLKPYLAATVAWLRWQIAGDQASKSWFVGPSCGFCKDTAAWTVLQKRLE